MKIHAVSYVLRFSTPFQVFGTIICFDFIDMIYHQLLALAFNEVLRNQPMNCKHIFLSIFGKFNL